MTFISTLQETVQRNQSQLCVGLDPDPQLLPASIHNHPDPIYAFCASIIEATADLVCAFKPNIAFFEALGASGLNALRRLMHGPRRVPFILDAKRGDMSSSAEAYARAVFEDLRADAVTLNPYQGSDALQPFLKYADRGCIILCRNSNPGSQDLQDLELARGGPLYLEVARLAQQRWNSNGNVGLVVGATQPQAIRDIRQICPDMPFLIPGVGAQGGNLEQSVRAAANAQGAGMIINASRSILYAASHTHYVAAARAEAIRLRDAINAALEK